MEMYDIDVTSDQRLYDACSNFRLREVLKERTIYLESELPRRREIEDRLAHRLKLISAQLLRNIPRSKLPALSTLAIFTSSPLFP